MGRSLPRSAFFLTCTAGLAGARPQSPTASELLRELTAAPRLAGTSASKRGAEIVAKHLRDAGFEVELDRREVLLSLPRALEVAFYETGEAQVPFHQRSQHFDPDAALPADIPPFNAWSASARVRGPVVDVGRGLREDLEALRAAEIPLEGAIALCAYGGAYRGVKPELAREYGLAGILLYNRSADSGPARGPVWPEGPWKDEWEAERGSILPVASGPGDPTTPHWPSPAPGADLPPGRVRRSGAELAQVLPRIPCLPIGAAQAELLLGRLQPLAGSVGAPSAGPGPVEAEIAVDAPRELRTIVNVIGRLRGASSALVIAGNHRDSWVRGANDAGGGTVSLLLAAARLATQVKGGWQPPRTILLAFWDAEEQGLIGSTEWAEAHAALLREHCFLYVNADTAVNGTKFGCSGTPGLERLVLSALEMVPDPLAKADSPQTLAAHWPEGLASPTVLGLPGSGSDFAVFLHHLARPVLDIGFGGSPASGQYHTSFDDYECIERFIDPGFVGHETAGAFLAALLVRAAQEGPRALDAAQAARAMALHARAARTWLGDERAESLATAFESLAAQDITAEAGANFYAEFCATGGLPGRNWFKLELWAPGLEKGYGSESFPLLRIAQKQGEAALTAACAELLAQIQAVQARWTAPTEKPSEATGQGDGQSQR